MVGFTSPLVQLGLNRLVATIKACPGGWSRLLLAVWLLGSTWPGAVRADVYGVNRLGYVSTPPGYVLNSRWGPGVSYGVYTKVGRGCTLELSGNRRNGWLELTNGTWVAANWVSKSAIAAATCPTGAPRQIATVTTPAGYGLNIRTGPGVSFNRVGQYLNNTRVALTGQAKGGWVELTTGYWVDSTFLKVGLTQPNVSPIMNRDPDVSDLQRRLQKISFLPANFLISGVYDQITQNAVREFQRVYGLAVTGQVDDNTRRLLYNATQSGSAIVGPTPAPINGGRQMRVSTDGQEGLVYDGPGPEYNVTKTLADGTAVRVTGKVSGNWSELSDGGWFFSSWLQPM